MLVIRTSIPGRKRKSARSSSASPGRARRTLPPRSLLDTYRLSDPKKKSAYDRFGIVDDDTASQSADPSLSLTSNLGWFGTLLFYSTLCVGLPVVVFSQMSGVFSSKEDQVETAFGQAKSLHGDLMALYEYAHFGSATLDCAQLYLALGKWELDDVSVICVSMQGLSTRIHCPLCALLNTPATLSCTDLILHGNHL